jgi:hypothetical protein
MEEKPSPVEPGVTALMLMKYKGSNGRSQIDCD